MATVIQDGIRLANDPKNSLSSVFKILEENDTHLEFKAKPSFGDGDKLKTHSQMPSLKTDDSQATFS